MRRIFAVGLVVLLSVLFIAGSATKDYSTQAIISIPNLRTQEISSEIEREFSSLSAVTFCKASLLTHSLTIQYDDEKLSKPEIEKCLKKWGCNPTDYSFNKTINFPPEE